MQKYLCCCVYLVFVWFCLDVSGFRTTQLSDVRVNNTSDRRSPKYQCSKCGIAFEYCSELQSELNMKDIKCPNCLQIYVHICAICSKTYKTKPRLHYHIKAVHETHKCSFCENVFTTIYRLRKHITSLHKDVPSFKRLYKCDICNKRFSGPRRLKYHVLSIHTDAEISDDDKGFLEKVNQNECPICTESFSRSLDLKTHAADIHELKTEFKCPVCSWIFHWKRALQVHVPVVHSKEIPMYSCSICDKKYYKESSLKDHVKSVHYNIRDKPCLECSLIFSTEQQLRHHERNIHHRNVAKKHVCPLCQKQLANPWHPKYHVRALHTSGDINEEGNTFLEQLNRNECPICKLVCSTSTELKSHVINIHQQETKFRCPLCLLEFSWKCALEAHLQVIHSNERQLYSCSICDKKYYKESSLKDHVKSVHDNIRDKPCLECPLVFSTA